MALARAATLDMRILLQQIGTGLYLKQDGWTKTPDDALVFLSAEVARSYSYDHGMTDTFVVLLPSAETAVPDNVIDLRTSRQWARKRSENAAGMIDSAS